MQRKAVIPVAAAAVVAMGLGAWWVVDATAGAEATERGACGSAFWEFTVEPEDGGTEVSVELQSSGPGEAWEVSLQRAGTTLLSDTRTTDGDGEIDVDAFSSADAEATYSVTLTPADGEPCTASIG